MQHSCEVCESFRKSDDLSGLKVLEITYPERAVMLCTGHAKIAENSGVRSFQALRELYGSGRRSYVPRRRPAALQPDGAERRAGRRSTDA